MENEYLSQMAKRWFSTSHEEEKYILTKEEEDAVIANEINRLRDFRKWKLQQAGISEWEIKKRLSEINWSERIDQEKVLKQANFNKLYQIWQDEQREKEKIASKEMIQKIGDSWTAKAMLKFMKNESERRFSRALIINQHNIFLIKSLCYFFSGDTRFESELGFSFQKGLLIRGISGIGKTYCVSCLENNGRQPITIFSMIYIAEQVKKYGEFVLPELLFCVCLDDVGTEEPTVNHFGTKVNFFKDFIETYYGNGGSYNRLIISTNYTFDQLEGKYGFRVRSRIKDMFNIIDHTGEDMRGK